MLGTPMLRPLVTKLNSALVTPSQLQDTTHQIRHNQRAAKACQTPPHGDHKLGYKRV